ncbi:hypothetical protein I4U23_007006 [Adineta vaga]|nr:hypothetical protein I4U23_007006 [Adineta vaga]
MTLSDLYLFLLILTNNELNSVYSLYLNENPYECDYTIETCGCSLNSPIFVRTTRIVGGEPVSVHRSWPWMVSVRKWGHHICGGVIISPLFILTAAHCIPTHGLSVAIGITQQSNLTNKDDRIQAITKVYRHSNWNAEKMHNDDLAILQLEHPLNNHLFNRICLPKQSDNLPIDSEVIAIGFGREKESSTRSSDMLRQIKLRILSPISQTCQDEYTDPDTQLCAGLETSNKVDTCTGDSGGPLMYFSPINNRFELVGIISFGTGCGHANHAVQQQKLFQKIEYLSSPPNSNLPIKSRSITSLQFTNTDIAYLDKLVRTASDRSIWTRDHSKSNTYHKSRRVPSGQIYYKT